MVVTIIGGGGEADDDDNVGTVPYLVVVPLYWTFELWDGVVEPFCRATNTGEPLRLVVNGAGMDG